MRLNKLETQCVEYLREWLREGCPKRVDGSFPTDFLTVISVLGKVPAKISGRRLEGALQAGIELSYVLPRHAQWSYEDQQEFKRLAGG